MNLIVSLQNLATPFITLLAVLFDFCGTFPFFVVLFSFFFLFVNKEFAYKYFFAFSTSFALSSLLLKNVVRRERPYDANLELRAERNSYSYAFPSFSATISSVNAVAFFKQYYKKSKSTLFKVVFVSLILIFVGLVGLSQIYLAENYLLDIIVGYAIGFLIASIIFKYLKITPKFIRNFTIIFSVLLAILFCFFFKDILSNNFSNLAVFEFVGLALSITLGSFIEQKFIKYKVKNNLFLSSAKVLIVVIIFIAFYFFNGLLTGHVIFGFIKLFLLGCIVTLVLPLIFTKIEKYFYCFSNKANSEKIVFSAFSLSLKQTRKIALRIFKKLEQGDCVLMSGDLGAGKSVIVREILKIAGITNNVTSPTFTLVNEYKTQYYHFYHFDMYRLESEEEAINIGFEEILDDKFAIKFIEWPEKVESFFNKSKYKKITIVKLGKKSRNIILENYVD